MAVISKCLRFIALLFTILCTCPAAGYAEDYVIGEGDTLVVSVWGVERLNFSVTVRPDGMITVPGLGDVSASGVKPRELQQELTLRLKELVKNPIVTVTVTGITNSRVYIFGSGIKSGVYDLTRKTSLLQILCTLGDIKSADLRNAYLMRKGKKIKEGFYRLFVEGDIRDDVVIESNDVIFVPLWSDKSVYVLGAVATPKAVEYRDGVTVMECILEAGGFTKFANENSTVIVRRDNGKEVELRVKLKKLLNNADLKQNIRLLPGDYVIVPESLF